MHFLVLWFFVSGFLKLVLIGLGLNISGFYNSFDSISNRENDWTARQDFTKNASQYVTKLLETTGAVKCHYKGSDPYWELTSSIFSNKSLDSGIYWSKVGVRTRLDLRVHVLGMIQTNRLYDHESHVIVRRLFIHFFTFLTIVNI